MSTPLVSPSGQPVSESVLVLLKDELRELGVKTLAGYPLPLDSARAALLLARALGGPGSGNFGHAGRPGQVGGSAPTSGEAFFGLPGYRAFDEEDDQSPEWRAILKHDDWLD